ncbi:MAG: carboxymuconolactone decarboxylase family protein [Erysipelotrichaceae bacterium]|nr:carboxymuconolactone decarboxylase family protein [Erysipelotrichaceae bacterium]
MLYDSDRVLDIPCVETYNENRGDNMNRIEKAKQMEKAHFPKVSFLQEALQELTNPEEPEIGSTVTEETRFQKGFDAQCSVFSHDAIQGGHDAAAIDLKHMQRYLSAHCFGDFYTRKGLDMRQRELLTFCTIASLGGCENQLRAHAKANLQAGNTRATLIEAITQCQPYIGFPRTLNAVQIIEEVSTTQ